MNFAGFTHLCPKPLHLLYEYNLSNEFHRESNVSENKPFDYLMLQIPRDIAAVCIISIVSKHNVHMINIFKVEV